MSDGNSTDNKDVRDSFIRWQGRTIEQFGYAINLILSLSIAAIGFELSLVLDQEFHNRGWQDWQYFSFGISLIVLLLSTGSGLLGVVNRLQDFRATTKFVRLREENGKTDDERKRLRDSNQRRGEFTWCLFWFQILAFGLGVLLLVVTVAGTLFSSVFYPLVKGFMA
ncbi:MAG: hypothetical protein WD045_04785 [Pirellulaceae bacterium]